MATTDGLTSEHDGDDAAGDDANRRVRIPYFPHYSQFRHLLRVWLGRPRKQITGLHATIRELRGTPQEQVDWTDPGAWIPERLEGADRELAEDIWNRSRGTVNPRHTYGSWLFAQSYNLMREQGAEGILHLTEFGQDFLEHPGGDAECAIDEAEGLIKLLSIIADNGPARSGGLVQDWADYLSRCSAFGAESTIKDTMRRRLNNLVERGLIERQGSLYSTTPNGLTYLQKVGDDDSGGGDHNQVRAMVRQQENTVRESLRGLLHDMNPFAFEHLIKRLLEELGYQNVEVTAGSGDGGVDVVADIELGITSVREVVQVKRHRRPIQRKDLDALRGSLYRFNAVRGTIVTCSRFAKGTQDAAFASGAAPITLIDGDKLIDLLIEHGIGVRKRTIALLGLDTGAVASVEPDD